MLGWHIPRFGEVELRPASPVSRQGTGRPKGLAQLAGASGELRRAAPLCQGICIDLQVIAVQD